MSDTRFVRMRVLVSFLPGSAGRNDHNAQDAPSTLASSFESCGNPIVIDALPGDKRTVTRNVRGGALSEYWHQAGNVWLWRYQNNVKNYRGWHLTADGIGAASLVELLDALARDDQPASRTIELGRPTPAVLAVPTNRNAKWTAPAKLRLGMASDPSEWEFTCTDVAAQLTFGRDWYPVLRQAVSGITLGEGDFSIGPTDPGQRLWLWWFLS